MEELPLCAQPLHDVDTLPTEEADVAASDVDGKLFSERTLQENEGKKTISWQDYRKHRRGATLENQRKVGLLWDRILSGQFEAQTSFLIKSTKSLFICSDCGRMISKHTFRVWSAASLSTGNSPQHKGRRGCLLPTLQTACLPNPSFQVHVWLWILPDTEAGWLSAQPVC